MSYEGFYGSDSGAVWYYPGWRCVHCGDIVDSVVTLNRRLNGKNALTASNGNGRSRSTRRKNRNRSNSGFDVDTYSSSEESQYVLAVSSVDDDWS